PTEIPIAYEREQPYPFGTPAKLPRIECIARFVRPQFARDKTKDLSQLVVIWYQDDFAFPVDEEIAEKFKAINWNAEAADGEW
ncbi:MAG: hypothetical protein ACYC6Y_23660, partial [Thermoguttaceae bacterium]